MIKFQNILSANSGENHSDFDVMLENYNLNSTRVRCSCLNKAEMKF